MRSWVGNVLVSVRRLFINDPKPSPPGKGLGWSLKKVIKSLVKIDSRISSIAEKVVLLIIFILTGCKSSGLNSEPNIPFTNEDLGIELLNEIYKDYRFGVIFRFTKGYKDDGHISEIINDDIFSYIDVFNSDAIYKCPDNLLNGVNKSLINNAFKNLPVVDLKTKFKKKWSLGEKKADKSVLEYGGKLKGAHVFTSFPVIVQISGISYGFTIEEPGSGGNINIYQRGPDKWFQICSIMLYVV